jgi:NADH pyrophosphatase NudC (nudix superfamily)
MILLSAAVALVLGSLVFTLFVRAKDLPAPETESPTAHLEERKAQIHENLRDLQFEFRVGKLSDADYQASKLILQKELAEVTARIEGSPAAPAPRTKPQPAKANVCPHCAAQFAQPLKFCGECGKPMTEVRR